MSYTLLITEKPSAARKISEALAEGPVKTEKSGAVQYQRITRGGKEIVVVSAVGHLFGVAQISKSWTYPVFDVEWKPTFEVTKYAAHAKKFYNNIKKLSKNADNFIVGTDLDVEGETIAFNILRFICGTEKAKRMEFSTLTKTDLTKSFDNMKPTINFGLAHAGATRHILDFYFGINLSRALTLSIKSIGKYRIMSSGRVQGPALKMLAEREKEIDAFKPVPYWQVLMLTKEFKASHEKDKFWKEKEAKDVVKACKGKDAKIESVEKKEYKQPPPTPFNLTDLQVEAHKQFGLQPKMTQQAAQKLYEAAMISYPRTSSQKLPATLNLKGIITKLGKSKEYMKLSNALLKRPSLKPHEGQKTDDAHPAIHPTGEFTKTLIGTEKKVYDLIVKRFMACFGDWALRESMNVKLLIDKERFLLSGKRTVQRNWMEFYDPYVKQEETVLPDLKEGQKIDVKSIEMPALETKPPNRYTQSSIIRELEKRELGTKATRADIVQSLFKREYVQSQPIEVTELGMQVIKTLEKFCPEILSEDLTRKFEKEMEEIRRGKEDDKTILDDAKEDLEKILKKFKENEKSIGALLSEAAVKQEKENSILGKCPKCGNNLIIMRSHKGGQFVGCSGYPKCNNIYPLPGYGLIKKAGKTCPECGTPIVMVIRKGKRPWTMCLDTKCKTKANWGKKPKGKK